MIHFVLYTHPATPNTTIIGQNVNSTVTQTVIMSKECGVGDYVTFKTNFSFSCDKSRKKATFWGSPKMRIRNKKMLNI